jgi:superoxide dismutase, Cu-Zn family
MRISILPLVAIVASCTMPETVGKQMEVQSVFARLYQVQGNALATVGQAQIAQFPNELKVAIDLNSDYLPPSGGPYGMHLHTIGKCELPDFASAGPHWNPLGKQHGRDNPMGSHAGDLPNINLVFGRTNSASAKITGFTLDQLMDSDGTAIMIHEKADDYATDPSGNSGKRIVCGVFTKP